MKWMKSQQGERVHVVVDGRILCMQHHSPAKFIEVIDFVDFSQRCQNCDKRWRERGRANRKPVEKPQVVSTDDYRPRHRVRW